MVRLSENPQPPNLNDMVINTPCRMDWNQMEGDERKRFCDRCQKSVYNIAEMSAADALELIGCGDRVCARIFRRADGTIVTSECPPERKGGLFQFSLSALVVLVTGSAAVFACVPWIGKHVMPLVQQWIGETEDSTACVGPETG